MKEFLVTVSSTAFVHLIVDEIEQDLEVHFKLDLNIFLCSTKFKSIFDLHV